MKKLILVCLILMSQSIYACSDHEEAMCLAKALYWESRGENILGKLAVASVIKERVNHNQFPNTVCDVVYQINKVSKKPEFSYNIVRNARITEIEAWEDSKVLAHRIVSGEFKYTLAFTALYFHSTSISPNWKSKKLVATIGRNKFYY